MRLEHKPRNRQRPLPILASTPNRLALGELDEGLIVDVFAGAGGASIGVEQALGRPIDIAINHNRLALEVHAANHPLTRHEVSDVWEVDPVEVTGGRPVSVAWFSPDCTHHSKAKGGKPRKQRIRSLAWVVCVWAKKVKPAVIFVENVPEFRDWGPLGPDDMPIKEKRGKTFLHWVARLRNLGYEVGWKVLDASLYGAPTKRKRLFMVARCDGQPITWPDVTHGPGKLPLHTAAECIDWTLPCPSIFERKRPLADKTLWRVGQGLKRFVLENPRPFIVRTDHHKSHATNAFRADEPLGTITSANGHATVVPIVERVGDDGIEHWCGICGSTFFGPLDTPYPSCGRITDGCVTYPNGYEDANAPAWEQTEGATAAPFIAGVGGRAGQSESTPGNAPVGTITAKGDRALIVPHLFAMNHSNAPQGVDRPLGTVTGQVNRFELVAPTLTKFQQNGVGQPIDQPIDTVMPGAARFGLIAPNLVKFRGDAHSSGMDEPVPTITSGGSGPGRPGGASHALGLLAPTIVKVNHGKDEARGEAVDRPLSTITATQRGHAVVTPVLTSIDQQGSGPGVADGPDEPLATITTKNRHAVIAPTLVQTGYGEREGQRPRHLDLHEPLGTLVAGGVKHAVVATCLTREFGNSGGADPREPMPTVMPGGSGKTAQVSAFLAKHYGGVVGTSVEQPTGTITSRDHQGLAAASLIKLRGECHGADLHDPLPTVTAGGTHIAEVRAFLTTFYGSDGTSGQEMLEPMRTITAKARLGLVTVEGVDYQIVDIGLRMLEPHELLAAQFGRYKDYDLSAARTKESKVKLIGNSVCPEAAEALVRANVPSMAASRRTA